MHEFDVKTADRVPEKFSGFLALDDGLPQGRALDRSISELYGVEDTVYALFLSEQVAGMQASTLAHYSAEASDYGFVLGGVITFGIHVDQSKLGQTHFDVITRELGLPLLQLEKPAQYPNCVNPLDQGAFVNAWIRNNPLKDLFSLKADIALDNGKATISEAKT